jgi:uncharacterized protein (TIGR03437 family)
VVFEPGATPRSFVARTPGFSAVFDETGIRFLFRGYPEAIQLRFLGSRPSPIHGLDPLPGRIHYFLGSSPAQWRANVQPYGKLEVDNLYPGIDLIYYGSDGRLEYDLAVRPGASPASIRLKYSGTNQIKLQSDGSVVASLAHGQLVQHKPAIYQIVDGRRTSVDGRFVLRRGELGLEVGSYDRSRTLIIDPVVIYSTYLGGSGVDNVLSLTVDREGYVYAIGQTTSPDFPGAGRAPSGAEDFYVTKLSLDGRTVVFTTVVGGSGTETPRGIAVDSSGSAYVSGRTASSDFPTTEGVMQRVYGGGDFDAFITRLRPDGSLFFSTLLGGSGLDQAWGIAVDSGGFAYTTGRTNSGNFPLARPLQSSLAGDFDAFVTKISPDGASLVYSTYLGRSQYDNGNGIAVDSAGSAFVQGHTNSLDFPITPGAAQSRHGGVEVLASGALGDFFVTKLAPEGDRMAYSTFLGGSRGEADGGIAVDRDGNAYVAGTTRSPDFPTTANAFQRTHGGSGPNGVVSDAAIVNLNAEGSAILYSSYLGGIDYEGAQTLAVDAAGRVFLMDGVTYQNVPAGNTPLTNDALQKTPGPPDDAKLAVFDPSGSLQYATLLGGNERDVGFGVAVDAAGYVYIGGVTRSTNFPTTAQVLSPALPGAVPNGFVTKILGPPLILPGGVTHGASFSRNPVAAGSIVSVFGLALAESLVAASETPLPRTLGTTSARMGQTDAPLYFVASNQINLQVPWELQGQAGSRLEVRVAGSTSPPIDFQLADYSPGIFLMNATQGAVLIANTVLLAAPANAVAGRASRPVRKGEAISIFCTGLGAVTGTVSTGSPAPSAELISTTTLPEVRIGGARAEVLFSGLAPDLIGVYQVNAVVPAGAASGSAVLMSLSIGGIESNAVTVAVE